MTLGGIRNLSQGRSDVYLIAPQDICVLTGFNTRVEDEELRAHIGELKASIKINGILEPLTVRYDKKSEQIQLRHGHCRLKAVLELISEGVEIKSVPVREASRYTNDADDIIEIVLRNDGMPLRPIERAEVYKRLAALNWTPKQIAEKVGRSVTHVIELLKLASAPESVKEQVRKGRVSATTACKVIREQGESAAYAIENAVTKSKNKGRATARTLSMGDIGKGKLPQKISQNDVISILADALRKILNGEKDPVRIARNALSSANIEQKYRIPHITGSNGTIGDTLTQIVASSVEGREENSKIKDVSFAKESR